MSRIGAAFRAFFRALSDAQFSESVERLLNGELPALEPAPERPAAPPKPTAPPAPARSEALTLLATLQREARFVDFVMEPLDDYSDEQVGAAVRDVHRECGKVLQRLLAIEPIAAGEEGTTVTVPEGEAGGRFIFSGNVTGEAPRSGTLVHGGWEAKQVRLPEWNGRPDAKNVIVPAEVEVGG